VNLRVTSVLRIFLKYTLLAFQRKVLKQKLTMIKYYLRPTRETSHSVVQIKDKRMATRPSEKIKQETPRKKNIYTHTHTHTHTHTYIHAHTHIHPLVILLIENKRQNITNQRLIQEYRLSTVIKVAKLVVVVQTFFTFTMKLDRRTKI